MPLVPIVLAVILLAGLIGLVVKNMAPSEGEHVAGLPTIYYFYSDTCPYCREMAPVTASVKKAYEGRINFETLEGTSERVISLHQKFQVRGYPTYVILNGEGEEVTRLEGAGWTLADFDEALAAAGVQAAQ